MSRLLDVVVPAGGTISEDYARQIGTRHRALAPSGPNGLPVLQRVVTALWESGCVRSIIGVAPPEVQAAITGISAWLISGPSGPANVQAGLGLLDPEASALVCTSDLPLLTAHSVRGFVERAQPDTDISLGLIRAVDYQETYPNAPMSAFVALADAGPVTMSCVFQVRPALLTRNADLLERAFAARKSQSQMASLLGLRLLWQFSCRRLTLAAVQKRAETLLRCRADVLLHCPPDLAFDIDTADDYAYAQARLHQTLAPDTAA